MSPITRCLSAFTPATIRESPEHEQEQSNYRIGRNCFGDRGSRCDAHLPRLFTAACQLDPAEQKTEPENRQDQFGKTSPQLLYSRKMLPEEKLQPTI